jgi:hypothetical protein
MAEQDFLFTKNQDRLLNFAGWAKNLAWVVLLLYIIRAALVPLFTHMYYEQSQVDLGTFPGTVYFWDMVTESPFYFLVDIVSDIVITLLRGVVFYVVLKGISLGLNMIVETDINYREQKEHGGEL